MKVVRILQLLTVLFLTGYLLLVHNINPERIELLLLPAIPVALAIGVALVLGWLVAWLPLQGTQWRLRRDNMRLRARQDELEQALARYQNTLGEPSRPIIPDRDAAMRQKQEDDKRNRNRRRRDTPTYTDPEHA